MYGNVYILIRRVNSFLLFSIFPVFFNLLMLNIYSQFMIYCPHKCFTIGNEYNRLQGSITTHPLTCHGREGKCVWFTGSFPHTHACCILLFVKIAGTLACDLLNKYTSSLCPSAPLTLLPQVLQGHFPNNPSTHWLEESPSRPGWLT